MTTKYKHASLRAVGVFVGMAALIASAATIQCVWDVTEFGPLWSTETGTVGCYSDPSGDHYTDGHQGITNCTKIVYDPNGVVTHGCVAYEWPTPWACTNIMVTNSMTVFTAPIEGGCSSAHCGTYVLISGPDTLWWNDYHKTDHDANGNVCNW